MCFQHFNSDRYLDPPQLAHHLSTRSKAHFHGIKSSRKEMRTRKTRFGGVKDVGGRDPFLPKSPSEPCCCQNYRLLNGVSKLVLGGLALRFKNCFRGYRRGIIFGTFGILFQVLSFHCYLRECSPYSDVVA